MENVEDILPLTASQHGVLFNTVQAGPGDTYFEQFHYTLKGPLNEPAFRRAWEMVVDRHPALRAAFLWKGIDEAVQAIRKTVKLPWLSADWSDLPAEQVTDRIARYLIADRRKGFQVEQAPLMRCAVVRQDRDRFHFIWSFHHLLMDGWSFSQILTEVSTLYAALSTGGPLPSANADAYRDFVRWQTGKDRRAAEDYWRDVLSDLTPPSLVDAAPSKRSYDAAAGSPPDITTRLSHETTEDLQRLARRNHVTLNVVVQTAWSILIARHTGTPDICFGYGTAGRPPHLAGIESTVGMIMTTLPMRVRVEGELPLSQALARLSERLAEQEEWSNPALAEIQQWAGVQGGGTPLFESVVAFENYPVDEGLALGFCGFDIEALSFFERTSFPIALFTAPGDALMLRLQFDPALFDEHWVQALSRRLAELLTSMADAADDDALSTLEMLTEDDRTLLGAALRTQPDGPEGGRSGPVDPPIDPVVAFDRYAAKNPSKPAIEVFGPEHCERLLTYGDVAQASEDLAAVLAGDGIEPGDFVAITLPRSAEFIIAALAVLRRGAAFVPIDPFSAPGRNRAILQDAAPKLTIGPPELSPAGIKAVSPTARPESGTGGTERRPPAPQEVGDPDGIAYVIYTSGSTGRPKGVPIRREALAIICRDWMPVLEMNEDTRSPTTASTAFDSSILEVWPTLMSGGTVVIPPAATISDPPTLRDWFYRARITSALVPTPVFAPLIDLDWPEEGAPKRIAVGGDRLPKRPPKTLPFPLINAYGPTETTVAATAGVQAPATEGSGPPDIGRLLPCIRGRMRDVHGRPAAPGVVAELEILGSQVTPGYLHRPEDNLKAFDADPFVPGGRAYRTGDRMRVLHNGRLEFVGRADHQVKVRGVRIELAEVETALTDHRNVAAALVDLRDGILCAWVEPTTPPRTQPSTIIGTWATYFDELHRDAASADDPDWDKRGWQGGVSAGPITTADMRDWINGTATRLRGYSPRSVLDVGCGTGLIVDALAPHCERYHAVDEVGTALDGLRRRQVANTALRHVTMETRGTDDLTGLQPQSYDLVILNSVIQYFPSLDYLEKIITDILPLMTAGGRLFLGDVRNLALLDVFHAEKTLNQMDDATDPATWSATARASLEEDGELVVDPRWFAELAERLSKKTFVNVMPKLGGAAGEASRYRFDVVFTLADGPDAAGSSDPAIITAEELPQNEATPVFETLKNRRLSRVVPLREWMSDPPPECRTVGDLRTLQHSLPVHGTDPDAVAPGSTVSLLNGDPNGDFIVLRGNAPEAFGYREALVATDRLDTTVPRATDPMAVHGRRELVQTLRQDLVEQLPAAFIPTWISVVDKLPRTAVGKIDRRSLGVGGIVNRQADHPFITPRAGTEEVLSDIWKDVLKIKRVSALDNFFALGGHSLKTTQVASRIQTQLGIDVPLSALFERPILRAMADYIDAMRAVTETNSAPKSSQRRTDSSGSEGGAREEGVL